MRRAHAIVVDQQEARVDGAAKRLGAADRLELGPPQIGAQRDRDEKPPQRHLQGSHPRSEHLLDPAGHRNVLPALRQAALEQRATELEDEQRVAERGLDDTAQLLTRHGEPQPLGQDAARSAEAERPNLQTVQRATGERPLKGGGLVLRAVTAGN